MRKRNRWAAWGVLLPAVLLSLLFAPSGARAANLRGGIGAGFLAPHDGEITDLYDPGVSFLAQVEVEGAPLPVRLALQGAYFQATGSLGSVFFVENAEAKLQWIPIELIASFPLSRATLAPYLGAGLELLWTRETFEYRLDGIPRRAEPDGRTDLGWLVVAGLDRNASPRLRLEGFASFVPTERKADRGGEAFSLPGDTSFNAGALGVRVLWRFP